VVPPDRRARNRGRRPDSLSKDPVRRNMLGAIIMAAAALTILRYREVSHVMPIGVFGAMLAVVALTV
jgi:hypothetical protein